MYIPQTYFTAVILMFMTMLCWGSWANTGKLDSRWRFELFYWDYTVGVLVTSFLFGITLGSFGDLEPTFFSDLAQADWTHKWEAFVSGVIFNVANILLVAAISIAGMAVAFPIGIGMALVIGTLLSYIDTPIGNGTFLTIGVFWILVAILLDAFAYQKISTKEMTKKGVYISLICGFLMGLFYPLLAHSMHGEQALAPYGAVFSFCVGMFLSNFLVNTIFMKKPVLGRVLFWKDYKKGTLKQHAIGWLGGLIWCVGISLNIIASTQAGPAVAYAFGQGATLIAALWGVFVWKEFQRSKRTTPLLTGMFLCYCLGLAFIGLAR